MQWPCPRKQTFRTHRVSKVATKAKLFGRELMLLDGALKSFRHTFDPVVETIISLNWKYSNDFALPGRGTPKRSGRLRIYASFAGKLSAIGYHVSAICSNMMRLRLRFRLLSQAQHFFARSRQNSALRECSSGILPDGLPHVISSLRWQKSRAGEAHTGFGSGPGSLRSHSCFW